MEISSLIGIIIALISILGGMVLKGAGLETLINPAAFLIIIGGVTATIFIAFPLRYIRKIPALLKIVFVGQTMISKPDMVIHFFELALIARKEGLLALESQLDSINDGFLRKGLTLIIDGSEPEMLEKILGDEILYLEERHRVGASIFSQAGTYAPTLGVLGAVVGLIASLGNLNDVEKLGHSIAAAFVATLLGIFIGYVICHPIANKLKVISNEEIDLKEMILEGVQCLQKGVSPTFIEQTMLARLSPKERRIYEEMKGNS